MEALGPGQSTFWLFSLRDALGRCESSPGHLGGENSCEANEVDGGGQGQHRIQRSGSAEIGCHVSEPAPTAEAPPGPGAGEGRISARGCEWPGKVPRLCNDRNTGKHIDDEFLRVGAGGRRQRLMSQIGRL